jgi:5'-3' exonuclease
MGIKSLNQLLKKYENIHQEISLAEYAYKKIAVDISCYIYKYKFSQGDKWLSYFINLVSCLRKNEIHCVFIYDSPAPIEKSLEQQKRRENREKDKQKIFELELGMEEFHNTGRISQPLLDLNERLCKKELKESFLKKKLSTKIDMRMIEAHVDKVKQRTCDITSEDFEKTKELFELLGIPFFVAPCEAETMCADLCKRGIVEGVLSEDTDVLAYGSPVFLSCININKDTCLRVEFPVLLEELSMDYEQFLDMCIMCGTDYNTNIEGVGIVNAYKLMIEFTDIDSLDFYTKYAEKEGVELSRIEQKCLGNIHVLNHKRTRELFKNYEKCDIEIAYCKTPDWKKLQEFLFVNNCEHQMDKILVDFSPQEIVFLDD